MTGAMDVPIFRRETVPGRDSLPPFVNPDGTIRMVQRDVDDDDEFPIEVTCSTVTTITSTMVATVSSMGNAITSTIQGAAVSSTTTILVTSTSTAPVPNASTTVTQTVTVVSPSVTATFG